MNVKRYYSILRPGVIDLMTHEGRSDDRYRRAAWTSITTAAARGIAILTGLISVPLTIHYLGAERFGLWMTITAVVTIAQFADFGIGNGLLNRIAEAGGRDDKEGISVLISNGIALSIVIAIFITGLFFIVNAFVSWPAIFNATSPIANSEAGTTTAVLVVIAALNIILGVVTKINIALQRGYINGIWQIFGSLTGLLLLIIAIQAKAGLPVLAAAFMSGPALATLMNGVLLFFHTHRWAKPSINTLDLNVAQSLARLGIWFFLFQVIFSLNNAVPNLVISHLLGLDQVAIFAVALKLASVAIILQTVTLGPLWPAYAEAKSRGDWLWIRRTLLRSLKLSGIIGLFASAVMIVFGADIIIAWINTETVPGQGVLWGLGAWVLCSSLYAPLTMFLNGMGKIKIQAIYSMIFSALMIFLCIILTRLFNLAGSAWAFGIAYTLPSIVAAGYITRKILMEDRVNKEKH